MGELTRGLGALVMAGLLSACSGHSTRPMAKTNHQAEASHQAQADESMAHYKLALGTTSIGAAVLEHPAPSYPSAMLASCPPDVRLHALLIVGTDGRVADVRVERSTMMAPAFAAAVRAAALRWRFEPLVISRWAADANDQTHTVDTGTRPFNLRYEFRFACHAGKAAVTSIPTTRRRSTPNAAVADATELARPGLAALRSDQPRCAIRTAAIVRVPCAVWRRRSCRLWNIASTPVRPRGVKAGC